MRRPVLWRPVRPHLAFPTIARAQIVAKINLSSQRMAVFVNGAPRYNGQCRQRAAVPHAPAPSSDGTVRYHRSDL